MRYRLTILRSFLDFARFQFALRARQATNTHASLRRSGDTLELVAPIDGARFGRLHEDDRARAGEVSVPIRLFPAPAGLERVSHLYWASYPIAPDPPLALEVLLHPQRGLSAAVFERGRVRPIDEVSIAGPLCERWQPALNPPDLRGDVPDDGRFSRYAGALGGANIHARLAALSVAIVGCSRLGSHVATALARAGVAKLVLVDDDVLEEHSLDAVECDAEAHGRPKVEAVCDHLAHIAPATRVEPVVRSVQDPEAIEPIASCDIVVSTPDRNDARLTAALVAAAHHRTHLDIGTGVLATAREERWSFDAGADVRLIVPGEGGCLLCRGGLDLERPRERDWRRERAGSLRSLNQVAVGQALLLLERYVAGDVEATTWMRLEVDRFGRLGAREMVLEPDEEPCVLCSEIAGCGDLAFGQPQPIP